MEAGKSSAEGSGKIMSLAVWDAVMAFHLAEFALRTRFRRDVALNAHERLCHIGQYVEDSVLQSQMKDVMEALRNLPDTPSAGIEQAVTNLRRVMEYVCKRWTGISRVSKFIRGIEKDAGYEVSEGACSSGGAGPLCDECGGSKKTKEDQQYDHGRI